VLNPVKPICISGISIEPTEDVELSPVGITIGEEVCCIEPKEDVACTPVKS